MFVPPSLSATTLSCIDFSKAGDIAGECKSIFDAYDLDNGSRDPSRCKALLQLRIADALACRPPTAGAGPVGLGELLIGKSAVEAAAGTLAPSVVNLISEAASGNPQSATRNPQFQCVFWSSKLAIDADGKAEDAQHLSGTQLDPADGQNDTSFHFADGSALSSERHPFIVLPGGAFRALTGLKLGDVAAVIYRNRITAAICGDIGPVHKIGEASIRVHEAFVPDAPDPCLRNPDGSCRRIHDVSIDEDVLTFAFPNSAFGPELHPDLAEAQIKARAYALFAQLQTPP